MKIKVILQYKDTQLKRIVKAGEELTVSNERGKQLILAKVGVEVPTDEVKTPTRKKKKKTEVVDE